MTKKPTPNQRSFSDKVIRPGSFNYAYYLSDRRPQSAAAAKPAPKKQPTKNKSAPKVNEQRAHYGSMIKSGFWLLLLVAGSFLLLHYTRSGDKSANTVADKSASSQAPSVKAQVAEPTMCTTNTLPQLALVSVSKRHMWACEAGKQVYDSPIVTGIEGLVADKTPRGTYHVYAKQTDLTLTGADTTGSWSDPVSYWMPFLYNEYGAYGFHDATWRPDSAFGNIDPNSSDGSHGCVELPLASAKWLYDWAAVGTTVTVQS